MRNHTVIRKAIYPPICLMLIMPLNVRGIGKPYKKTTLKIMVDLHHPQVIMLQETLAVGDQILSKLKVLLPSWDFSGLYGKYGGLLMGRHTNSMLCVNYWSIFFWFG